MWLTSRHLEGGTAEIRFVVDGVGARVAYITAKKKKRAAPPDAPLVQTPASPFMYPSAVIISSAIVRSVDPLA